MTEVYRNAFKEVKVILEYLDDESYYKIPQDVIEAISENQNEEYDFYIDESIPFAEQNILSETRAILFNIYRDYIADDDKKKIIQEAQHKKMIEIENKKREKYNPDNIFKKNENTVVKNNDVKENVASVNTNIIPQKKESWLQKLFTKIKNFF